MVAYVFNPSTRGRDRQISAFEASQLYIRSSSLEIHRDILLILILMIKKTHVAKWHSQELGLSATKSGV